MPLNPLCNVCGGAGEWRRRLGSGSARYARQLPAGLRTALRTADLRLEDKSVKWCRTPARARTWRLPNSRSQKANLCSKAFKGAGSLSVMTGAQPPEGAPVHSFGLAARVVQDASLPAKPVAQLI